MKATRIAVLLALIAACTLATAQVPSELDYAVEISEGGVAVTGGEIIYAPVVTADWWTTAKPAFVVRMVIPSAIEPASTRGCEGELEFDRAARVLTWTDRLDNEFIALKSCPIVFRVDPAATPGTPYTLEATLVPSAPDRNPANNVDTHTGVVLAASDLELTGAVDVLRYKPGALVTYTFTLTNHGPQAAHDVGFNDQLSPHHTAVSSEQTSGPAAAINGTSALIPLLAVGESATFRLVTRAKTDFEAADIRNQASVGSPNLDLHDRDNDSILWTYAGPDADVGVSSVQGAAVAPSRIPVTIHVRNNGPDPVQNARVRNALGTAGDEYDVVERVKIVAVTASQGTCSAPEIEYPFAELPPPPHWMFDCTLGPLAVGAEARIDLVIERTSGRGAMRLSSVVTPGQNDPRPADNVRQLIIEEGGPRRRSVRK